MKPLTIVLLLQMQLPAHAELSAFEQALQNDSAIETRESVEVHGGIKYRKVESNMGIFYFKLVGRNGEASELDCKTDFNGRSPHLVTVAVQVFRRSRVFIRGLKETCANQHGTNRYNLDWTKDEMQVGVEIPDSKKGVLKNQKSFVTPTPKAGYSGEF